MRQLFIPWVLAVAVAATGCATMAHGPAQTVTVTSDPSGAHVTVLSGPPTGSETVRSTPGVTPIKASLARRDRNLVIRLEKEGCEPAEIRLKRTISGWTVLNLMAANPSAAQGRSGPSDYPSDALKGLALGFGIDFISGAAFEFPKSVQATLKPASGGQGSCSVSSSTAQSVRPPHR